MKHDAVETSGFVQNYVTPEGVHSIIISQYSANGPPTVRQTPLRPATVFRLKCSCFAFHSSACDGKR